MHKAPAGRRRSNFRCGAVGCAIILWLCLGMFPASTDAVAAQAHIILCGSGGEKTYQDKFAAWGQRLQKVLAEKMGASAGEIVLLMESADSATSSPKTSDLETLRSVLGETAGKAGPDGDLFLYLIGHGSFLHGVCRFHIPGPDLTAEELARLIEPVRARRVVVINAASSSAGFINALSRSGRIICTATKSVEERNATEFMEHFLEALEDGSADQNRDERISVLEACRQAAALTDASYVGQGLIATEHALLDDNGDGQGTRLAGDPAGDAAEEKAAVGGTDDGGRLDGVRAAQCFLKDFSFPASVPRELVDRYRALLDRIEDLKSKKSQLAHDAYYAALEPLLLDTARVHRDIRRAAGQLK